MMFLARLGYNDNVVSDICVYAYTYIYILRWSSLLISLLLLFLIRIYTNLQSAAWHEHFKYMRLCFCVSKTIIINIIRLLMYRCDIYNTKYVIESTFSFYSSIYLYIYLPLRYYMCLCVTVCVLHVCCLAYCHMQRYFNEHVKSDFFFHSFILLDRFSLDFKNLNQ